jgi:hypothetical protein
MMTSIIGLVQPNLGLKVAITTTIIGLNPTRIIGLSLTLSGPNSIYNGNEFGAWPNKIWVEFA